MVRGITGRGPPAQNKCLCALRPFRYERWYRPCYLRGKKQRCHVWSGVLLVAGPPYRMSAFALCAPFATRGGTALVTLGGKSKGVTYRISAFALCAPSATKGGTALYSVFALCASFPTRGGTSAPQAQGKIYSANTSNWSPYNFGKVNRVENSLRGKARHVVRSLVALWSEESHKCLRSHRRVSVRPHHCRCPCLRSRFPAMPIVKRFIGTSRSVRSCYAPSGSPINIVLAVQIFLAVVQFRFLLFLCCSGDRSRHGHACQGGRRSRGRGKGRTPSPASSGTPQL